jgi:hypothetical protein
MRCENQLNRILLKCTFVVSFLLLFFTSNAQDLTWEPKSGIPEYGLNAASFFTINNKLYVVNEDRCKRQGFDFQAVFVKNFRF